MRKVGGPVDIHADGTPGSTQHPVVDENIRLEGSRMCDLHLGCASAPLQFLHWRWACDEDLGNG
jgi:hypothetical protein